MKASDYISNCITKEGVNVVFGYQGGNIAHVIDSIAKNTDLKFVTTYNEQGAAFAACGYAIEHETIGVALASSGPGAINLISGIASAYYDSIPTLFLTGNVSLNTMKFSDNIRQNAFQENDIVSMVSKVTKYAVTVKDAHDLRFHIEKALYLAKEGRPGPVLLDLPHNIQKADLDFENEHGFIKENEDEFQNSIDFEHIISTIKNSRLPLMVVGGGAENTSIKEYVGELLKSWKMPVVATLRGLDVVPHDYIYFAGLGGAYGTRAANLALKYADTILVFGSRLDERFICTNDKNIFDTKNIIHVDIDDAELGRVLGSEYKVRADIGWFLEQVLAKNKENIVWDKWGTLVKDWKEHYSSVNTEWSINKAVYELTSCVADDATITIDIGINQMCSAQSMVLKDSQRCLTSAGHGAMGCSLPMAIGAAYAGEKTINCFVGDGALHMNIQELLVLSRDKLPIHVILNNNNCLGMIRDFQTKAFESRFVGTMDEFQGIDYEQIAKAYKISYIKACSLEDLNEVKEFMNSKIPCFIELCFPEKTDTNPRLGMDMFNQIPSLTEQEIRIIEEEVAKCKNIIF